MAKLYIREYSRIRGGLMAGPEPGTDQPPITLSGTSQRSATFGQYTQLVRLHTDGICSVVFGEDPTATVDAARMAADSTEYFGVRPGFKVAVIENT
jgi:hypothetical protein